MAINLKKFNKDEFGKVIIPEKIFKFKFKEELQKLYEKLYFDNINYAIITNLMALSIILSIVCFFLGYDLIYSTFNNAFFAFHTKFAVIFLSFVFILFFCYYFVLFAFFFMNESKFKNNEREIEEVLPEFLDNLISNIKGGIPLEKALLKSVQNDQKALKAEITLINQKIMMGETIYESLHQFRKRFDSAVINRTIFLIEEGIKNGGNIVAPLERISENLKRIYNLDAEIKANSGGFTTVIKAITLFIAPLLFALATTLLVFIGNLFLLIIKSGSESFSVSAIPSEYNEYLIIFSYSMITLITFFSSLITAELKNEKIHESIKYLPIYVVLGLIIFKVLSKVLLNFFSNIM